MANIDQAMHDNQTDLEVNQPIEALVEEGAEEPIPVQKDSCQQHEKMLRYKSPIVPSLNLQNYDRRSTKNRSGLRSQKSII